jgi:hypothetical protein
LNEFLQEGEPFSSLLFPFVFCFLLYLFPLTFRSVAEDSVDEKADYAGVSSLLFSSSFSYCDSLLSLSLQGALQFNVEPFRQALRAMHPDLFVEDEAVRLSSPLFSPCSVPFCLWSTFLSPPFFSSLFFFF